MKNIDTIGGMRYNYRKEFVETCRQRQLWQRIVDGKILLVTQRMSYQKPIVAQDLIIVKEKNPKEYTIVLVSGDIQSIP
jgi:hypothetical protein